MFDKIESVKAPETAVRPTVDMASPETKIAPEMKSSAQDIPKGVLPDVHFYDSAPKITGQGTSIHETPGVEQAQYGKGDPVKRVFPLGPGKGYPRDKDPEPLDGQLPWPKGTSGEV